MVLPLVVGPAVCSVGVGRPRLKSCLCHGFSLILDKWLNSTGPWGHPAASQQGAQSQDRRDQRCNLRPQGLQPVGVWQVFRVSFSSISTKSFACYLEIGLRGRAGMCFRKLWTALWLLRSWHVTVGDSLNLACVGLGCGSSGMMYVKCLAQLPSLTLG